MAWIEAHQSLRSHRKTGRLARALGISKPQAIGHLMCLWWWCLDNAPSGDIQCCDAEDLAEAAEWEGKPSEFVLALISAGYVDVNDADEYTHVHDWMDYAGRLVQKRAANAERMRRARSENKPSTTDEHGPHVTPTCDERASHVQGLQYQTVPNQTKETPPLPPWGDGQVFAWAPAMDTKGNTLPEVPVPFDKLGEWRATYPAKAVEAEVRACIQWMRDNPDKQGPRPLARIGSWLNRANDRPVSSGFRPDEIGAEELAQLEAMKALAKARHVRN